MTTQVLTAPRWRTAVLWALQLIAAAMFLLAGTLKLSGAPAMVQLFDAVGVGQWFRYVTGTIEVASAILLFTPLAFFGAAALALTMVCAVLTHLFIVGGNPIMAVLLFGATATIASMRRSER
jgi:uncharacterized membrane protein YphA (DoxX/SURF4 family)